MNSDRAAILEGAMYQKIEEAVLADGQKEYVVSYAAYPDDANGEPIDNLNQVAVPGRVIFVKGTTVRSEGRVFRSPVLESPTWLQVCIQANRAIIRTRDWDHVFLEGLDKVDIEDGVTIYRFSMGS